MAEHEPDGINEAFQASVRVAITAAGLVAERLMRQREQAHRDAEAEGRQATLDLRARIAAERVTVRAELFDVQHDAWWRRAGAQEIGDAWQTAQGWRSEESVADWTADRIRDELRRRYAIDVNSLDADRGAVQDALERRERALRLATQARETARGSDAVAAPLMVAAGRADRQQNANRDAAGQAGDGARADRPYDSAERRSDLAAELESIADDETIQARVVADTNQALPAEEALSSAPKRAAAARRSRGTASHVRSPARRSDRGR